MKILFLANYNNLIISLHNAYVAYTCVVSFVYTLSTCKSLFVCVCEAFALSLQTTSTKA